VSFEDEESYENIKEYQTNEDGDDAEAELIGLGPGEGLQVLLVQDYIYTFLVKICETLLVYRALDADRRGL
jgi:hypothetical protein